MLLAGQIESAYITGVSADGRTLTLDRALKYSHAGTTLTVPPWGTKGGNGTSSVVLAAVVGLLSRNIQFGSADASVNGYGAHITVGELPLSNGAVVGSMNLR